MRARAPGVVTGGGLAFRAITLPVLPGAVASSALGAEPNMPSVA
jgi:hypothetical protein